MMHRSVFRTRWAGLRAGWAVGCGSFATCALLAAWFTAPARGQEVQPRLWSHLPAGISILGAGYYYTDGDIYVDPVLRIEDAKMRVHTVALQYIRSFAWFGRPARLDLFVPHQWGSWTGLVNGAYSEVERTGPADPTIRLGLDLRGPPASGGARDRAVARAHGSNTIVGGALAVTVPIGVYHEDKLINLGGNRFVFKPQLGVQHNRGRWTFETSGSVWVYTDNESFYGRTTREQDPLVTVQAHVIRNVRPGFWLGVGSGYGFGGESTVRGVKKNDRQGNLVWAATCGYPLTSSVGLKASWVGSRTQRDLGLDSDSFALSTSYTW